ncbi:hypothetical protein KRR55_03640 [Paeniglutamicibacter sp. ABSL32-1]|uniref:hypothetical protein n=1 Tax=Paeniglutamicibacter quisquiliarum TaxID=2849498 RepID=UPI001C2CCCD6|nr:hypothetical protein [Paeniglutamicibacter quisquiliarum]MBV1778207.1 hypothetical protein [Paeniglutamicibacter quisquiliarum]
MGVSMKEVLEVLEPDEPSYPKAAALGPESLPHLRTLVGGNDPMLAAKAAYAASLLEGGAGRDVVAAAAHSDTASVRVAAAAAAGNLPTDSAAPVLMDLVDDNDAGVRKVALSAVPQDAPRQLTEKAAARSSEEAGGGPNAAPRDLGLGGGSMPGEHHDAPAAGAPAPGLMPGEKPGPPANGEQGQGLMPGETG